MGFSESGGGFVFIRREYFKQADLLERRAAEADKIDSEAVTTIRDLVSKFPNNPDYELELSNALINHAIVKLVDNKSGDADKLATEQFNLVVLGQFKRGKSTLINALLGTDLLPTAVVPLTSIVTIIQPGPQPHAVVRFLDGRTLEVDVADLALYST